MLKALVRWLWPVEAPRTPSGHNPDYVTRAELAAEIAKFEQRTEFELGEWYDKFSALHARAEKRVNRDKRNRDEPTPRADQLNQPLSALAFRKPWSV